MARNTLQIIDTIRGDLWRSGVRVSAQDVEGETPMHLVWMLDQLEDMYPPGDLEELLKMHRWIGYIQGSMVQLGLSTLTAERDRVRQGPSSLESTLQEIESLRRIPLSTGSATGLNT